MGEFNQFGAPEILKASENPHLITLNSPLTGPADVYSLGLVLWAIAEEKWRAAV
jgi:hypothetical protein